MKKIYFSVNKEIVVNKKRFLPCICYMVSVLGIDIVEELEKKGFATTYESYAFFANGKKVDKKETKTEKKKAK